MMFLIQLHAKNKYNLIKNHYTVQTGRSNGIRTRVFHL